MKRADPHETALKWNAAHPVGTPVTRYKLINPLREPQETETTSEAWVMGGHSVMVKVKGVSGGVLAESVVPRSVHAGNENQPMPPVNPNFMTPPINPNPSPAMEEGKALGNEAPIASKAGTPTGQMERHTGFSAHRLSPQAGNPREVAFADEWREQTRYGMLGHLIPDITERDERVAATIIQWLGSNVGMCFLRDVVKSNKQVAEYINS